MNENTDNQVSDCGTIYRGHQIRLKAAGHPQAQNIFIDGEESGYVIFPEIRHCESEGNY